MDISENGWQIAEKLLVLLDDKQRKEAAAAIISRMGQNESAVKYPCATRSLSVPFQYAEQPITEIQEGGLYFYPELRKACVGDTEIELTVKEYDALHLLISNRNRILTYETLARQIWGEEYKDKIGTILGNYEEIPGNRFGMISLRNLYRICIGIGGDTIGKLAVLDLSENGRQIGEKLFTLLNEQQKRALTQYVLDWKNKRVDAPVRVVPKHQQSPPPEVPSFTEIQVDDLFFCLEERKVLVRGQEIPLTAREFNAFQLLITNRRQVMTFEIISEHIWGYGYDSVENMLGAIHNIMSRVKLKLKIAPDIPNYITSVRGVGYKFNK